MWYEYWSQTKLTQWLFRLFHLVHFVLPVCGWAIRYFIRVRPPIIHPPPTPTVLLSLSWTLTRQPCVIVLLTWGHFTPTKQMTARDEANVIDELKEEGGASEGFPLLWLTGIGCDFAKMPAGDWLAVTSFLWPRVINWGIAQENLMHIDEFVRANHCHSQ